MRQRLTCCGACPPSHTVETFLACPNHHAAHDSRALAFHIDLHMRRAEAAQADPTDRYTWAMARQACLKACVAYKRAREALKRRK